MNKKLNHILNSNLSVAGRIAVVLTIAAIVFGVCLVSYQISMTQAETEPGAEIFLAVFLTAVTFPFLVFILAVVVWFLVVMPSYYIITGKFYPLIDDIDISFERAFFNDIIRIIRLCFLYVFGDWKKRK